MREVGNTDAANYGGAQGGAQGLAEHGGLDLYQYFSRDIHIFEDFHARVIKARNEDRF